MRLLRSKPSFSAFWNASGEAQDHLRISEVDNGPIPLGDDDLDYEEEEEPVSAAARTLTGLTAPLHVEPALQDRYERSVERIESCIYALATAVTALDSVESKLSEAREQIAMLRRRGRPVDGAKVHRTLIQLAEHVNTTIGAMDRHGVNLLRDSRVSIKLTEIDDSVERAVGIELTLISLDKLMAYRLKDGGLDEDEAVALIDNFSSVVFNNVQVLSSAILALLASRDYTDEVTRLVLTESISRRPAETAMVNHGESSLARLEHDAGPGSSTWAAWKRLEDEQQSAPRKSLVALIDRLRDGRQHQR